MKKLTFFYVVLLLVMPVCHGQFRDFFWSQTGGGPEGGYIYDVEIVPPNGSVIFVATEDAGLFVSRDGGQVWDKAGLFDLTVRTIAVNPLDRDILYAGTWDERIFKSTDSGKTWIEKINGLPSDPVMDIVCHPSQVNLVFAAMYGGGIAISEDGGESWYQSNDGLSDNYVNRILMDPNDNDVIYAGVYNDNVPLNISTDRGQTWSSLSNGLPNSTCRDIDVFQGDSNIIFVALEGDYLYRTLDGGTSWEQMDSDQGFTDSNGYTIRIHPTDSDIAWAGSRYRGAFKTVDGGDTWVHMGDEDFDPYVRFLAQIPGLPEMLIMGNQDGSGLYKTTDGGDTWNEINTGFTNVDVQCMAIHPDVQNLMYAGTRNRGVFRSTDYGRTWEERNVQLGPRNIYALATADLEVWAGTSSGIYRGLDGGNIWAELTEGIEYSDDILTIAIKENNASYIVLGSVSVADGDDYAGGIYYTTNRGEEWIAVDIDRDSDSTIYVRDLVFAEPAGRMYAATSEGVYRSDNNGQSWSPTGYIYHDTECVTFDSRGNGRVYAGSDDGIFMSSDAGATWEFMVSFIQASDMAVDVSRNPSWVYAVAEGGVFVSDNNGINWATSNDGLTNRHVSTIMLDSFDPEVVYVGTLGSGVFTTADATPPEIPEIIDATPLDGGVRIQWKLGAENDLAGYRVYYDTDSPLPPFDGTSSIQGSSPVEAGVATSMDLYGFANGQAVYVAVTAYDDVGNESYYSDVQTVVPDSQPHIVMAGYGDSFITSAGGDLKIIAWAMDIEEDAIESVEMYYGGQPVNFKIPGIGGGVFQMSMPMPSGMAALSEIFELVAVDENGTPSGLWPYLNVSQANYQSDSWEYYSKPPVIQPWWYQKSRSVADGNGPFIYAAGYHLTRVSSANGGEMNLIAVVMDYQDSISGVQLYFGGAPTGLFLQDDGQNGDFAPNDGIYGIKFNLPSGSLAPMDYLLELKATNTAGQESDLWPYFTVH